MSIEGLEKLQKRLDELSGARLQERTQAAALAIGEGIRANLARYPGPVKYPIRWASRKQRFYVLRVLRADLGPYVRNSDPQSQRLGPSWTVEPAGRYGAVIGTRVTYAPFVQSAERQQPFHRETGWVTDRQAVDEYRQSGDGERQIGKVITS